MAGACQSELREGDKCVCRTATWAGVPAWQLSATSTPLAGCQGPTTRLAPNEKPGRAHHTQPCMPHGADIARAMHTEEGREDEARGRQEGVGGGLAARCAVYGFNGFNG